MDTAHCTWCDRPGVPYEYHGEWFDGLCAFKGDRLCPSCRDARMHEEGVNIRVIDRRTLTDYVVNTADQRRAGFPVLPKFAPGREGTDGRDLKRRRRN